jgi:hypothetical protein
MKTAITIMVYICVVIASIFIGTYIHINYISEEYDKAYQAAYCAYMIGISGAFFAYSIVQTNNDIDKI